MTSAFWRRRQLLVLLAVAILARAATFGNPLVHVDEQFYFVTARAWLEGALPYVEVWDRKPLGLFAIYLLPAALGVPVGIWAYQALALACVVGTALLIAALARAAGWSRGALLAGVGYILWLNLAGGQSGQSPVFYNLPMAGAAWLLLGERASRWSRAAAGMALVGLAMQVKYTAVFEGAFFGLWTMAQEWRRHRGMLRTLALGGLLVTIAALPTLLVMGFYALSGHWDAFWFANVTSILARHADPINEAIENLAVVLLILAPLLALSMVGWADARRRGLGAEQTFLFGWLASAIAGLLVFGTWFDHYALPVMVPASICAAGAVANRARVERWSIPVLLAIALIGQVKVIGTRLSRGSSEDLTRLAQAVRRAPPGCLYVYAAPTIIYPASGRCRPTRYLFPSHLSRLREEGAIGVDQEQELRRIFTSGPAVVVLGRAFEGERPQSRALMLRLLRPYRRIALLRVGETPVAVFASTRPR